MSRYRGTTRRPSGRWRTQVSHLGVHQLGPWDTELEAAVAYDFKARELKGPGAVTNQSLGLLPERVARMCDAVRAETERQEAAQAAYRKLGVRPPKGPSCGPVRELMREAGLAGAKTRAKRRTERPGRIRKGRAKPGRRPGGP